MAEQVLDIGLPDSSVMANAISVFLELRSENDDVQHHRLWVGKKKGGGERAPTVTEGGMAGVVTAEEC
ncbi:hypothetical protein N7453_006053 [Penicillium expansum]|nr:hypothetical protein N7453_006053 [Penicillium expansum]